MADIEAAKAETLQLLGRARALVKESESLFENCFPVPALNEFRNVAYHLAEHIQDPTNGDAIFSALRHAKKAYLDANEAYALSLCESAELCTRDCVGYSHILVETLPNYREQLEAIQKLKDGLASSPGDSSEDRFARANDLEKLFPVVKSLLYDLHVFRDPIQDKIRKSKDATKQWIVNIIVAIVTAAATIVIPRLLG